MHVVELRGNIEAKSLDAACRFAAERWPRIRLTVDEQRIDMPTTPKAGWGGGDQ
jgi:hypothetical protein